MFASFRFQALVRKSVLFGLILFAFCEGALSRAQTALVKFEAESGVLGSDFAMSNGTPSYITITTDSTGNNPSNAARVATFTVTFPAAGTYNLYAKIRVGPAGASDDSLFYGNGFGTNDPTVNSDWILVNNLGSVGFTNPTNVVTGGGSAGAGVWKWINLSQFAPGPTFTVTSGARTQTFQIGARENGFDMDAFAFGLNSYTFTVSNRSIGHSPDIPSSRSECLCCARWDNPKRSLHKDALR